MYVQTPGDGLVMQYRDGKDQFTERSHIGCVLRTAVGGGGSATGRSSGLSTRSRMPNANLSGGKLE